MFHFIFYATKQTLVNINNFSSNVNVKIKIYFIFIAYLFHVFMQINWCHKEIIVARRKIMHLLDKISKHSTRKTLFID